MDGGMTAFMKSVMKMVKARRRRVSKKCAEIRDLTSGTRIGRSNDAIFKVKNQWAGNHLSI